jgi:Na+-transporting NADH:ubiquinone oxidoreductase subunit E
MTCTAALNYFVYYHVLVPLSLEHFRYIVFIIIIAAFVQLVEMAVERFFPALYFVLGIFLPLITVNCAILGASLFLIIREYTLGQSIAYGAGSGVGWMMAIIAVGAIREKLQKSARLPKGLDGPAITLIITGLMSLAFMAFSGMIQIQ